jgi:magnesium-transporting ATPase (P-type)
VARRRATAGKRSPPRTSRSYAEIVWANTFTLFNGILGALFVLIVALGEYRDALFGGIILANALIGIIQEIRAKRTLDRLALLVAPKARVVRDAEERAVPVDDLVVGDLVRVEPGDQVVADGEVVEGRGLSLDESILTGESDSVTKEAGDEVLSGAFCVAGAGEYEVRAVGPDSFAERLAAEARGTRTQLSPLQLDINRVLKITVWAMIPLSIALIVAQLIHEDDWREAAVTVVAGLVPLVPEGLVLLTSLTFAVAAVNLARIGALAQQLNAVESMASVNTVCTDKTGTLTENRLDVLALEAAPDADEEAVRRMAAALAASAASRNSTMEAVHAAFPGEARAVAAEVPFASSRKWSGVTLDGGETIVMGAPDVLERTGVAVPPSLAETIAARAAERRRVVLLASGSEPLEPREDGGDPPLPALRAVGVVVLAEGLRPDAAGTVAYLQGQDVRVKVISGDGVGTVQAAGPDLPADPEGLREAAGREVVFGRISPEQKRGLVTAMADTGQYTAMIGDGVNDVLALKQARLAVAMGNGSQMAKGVADIVLLTNAFSTLPRALEEGRRILRNCHRVAKLFVTKSVYAAVLIATIGLAPVPYPFLPRHLTVISTLTIGVPAFFLALAPSSGPVKREGFLASLMAFSIPAGIVSGLAIQAGYLLARGPLDSTLISAQTVAVLVAILVGLAVLIEVERGVEGRRVRWWVWLMVIIVLGCIPAGLALPFLSDFFAIEFLDAAEWGVGLGVSAVAIGVLLGLRRIPWLRRLEARGS